MRAFFNPYSHSFLRVGVATPLVHLGDPAANLDAILALAQRAHDDDVALALYPELSLSAYALDDLHLQSALQQGVLDALAALKEQSAALFPLIIVGAPLGHNGRLYNCAVFVHRGSILAVTPKCYLPNEREFYEKRQFTSGLGLVGEDICLLGARVPFGTDVMLEAQDHAHCAIHAEICEDLWSPLPPSGFAALHGASVLLNLSASTALVGKTRERHALCQIQSSRYRAAYLYASCGAGESSTDVCYDGEAIIYENGILLGQSARFARAAQLTIADIDLERLTQERMRQASFGDALHSAHVLATPGPRVVPFMLGPPLEKRLSLRRTLSRYPLLDGVLSDTSLETLKAAPMETSGEASAQARTHDALCHEAYHIQATSLAQRLHSTGLQKLVIGISGGLDSTHALLVCCAAMERLSLPRHNILAFTLPAFATSAKTLSQARALMQALGVGAHEMDITPACMQMLKDLNHPASEGVPLYDITFENVQAGARTSLLFRLANQHSALVVGTGDLSELALGWCTYGVGDQMAHYNVNSGVPKTLIQALIEWVAKTGALGVNASALLLDILATDISPELVPAQGVGASAAHKADMADMAHAPAQKTEDVIGPYALNDFFLHYASRFGFAPYKIAYLAHAAWGSAERGHWPSHVRDDVRRAYDISTIKRWLGVFVTRFYGQSQFKRTAMPNGPKVLSAGALSPRGDWRAPSDATATLWLKDLARVPDDERQG